MARNVRLTSGQKETEKTRRELAVFDEFSRLVGFNVVRREKTSQSGEIIPDIHCWFADGTMVAYELVQLVEPRLSAKEGRKDLALRRLIEEIDTNGAEHLHPWYVRVSISDHARSQDIKAVASKVVTILNQLPADFEGEVPSSQLEQLLPTVRAICVKNWGTERAFPDLDPTTSWTDPEPGGVCVTEFGWEDLVHHYATKLNEKFRKQYESDCPRELVAWCGQWGWGYISEMWLPKLTDAIGSRPNLGGFRRVWVVDLLHEPAVLLRYPNLD